MREENEKSTSKKEEFDLKINNLESEYRIKEAKLRFLQETEKEKEGYQRSVKSLLEAIEQNSSLKHGVRGVLANLISVEKEYETAIEIALGAAIQNIVTDTEEEAKKLVKYLKDNKLGRASFLPITSVKGTKLGKYKDTGISGIVGVASDLIDFDKKYEGIILNLLGRTVVVENIDSAVELAKKNSYSFKIVTVSGDVINPSGAISGGSVQAKTVSILGRGKEIKSLEKELKDISNKIEKIKEEKEAYILSIKDMLERYEVAEKEYREVEIVFATEKQKIDNLGLEILKLEAKRDKLKDDLVALDKEREDTILKQKEYDERQVTIDEENASLNRVIEEFTNLNKDNQRYIDDLNFDITNLKISVSSFDESENSINEMVERIEQDINNNLLSIDNKKKVREEIIEENKKLTELNVEINLQITKLEEEILGSSDKVESLKQERLSKNDNLNTLEENILEQSSRLEEIRNQISKIDLKKSKIELELNQIINKMWEEYELTPNNVEEYKEVTSPHEVQKQVNSLRSEIRDLGSINVDSIQEYKEVKERYDFLSEQRYDLE